MILLIQAPSKKKIEIYDIKPQAHIGLAYIAAYLRSKKTDVNIIDGKFDKLDFNQVLNKIKDFQPSIIGLTAMTHEIDNTSEFAKMIKQNFPLIKIVIGGVHATLLPLKTMEQYPFFDFLIFGEGEITLYELQNSLSNYLPLNKIKGLVYRDGEKLIQNEARQYISNLDELPFPAWDLFRESHWYPILSSRGCPFQCIFCNRVLGNRIRYRSVENIIDEIEFLINKYNMTAFYFMDETFSVSIKRAHLILDEMIKRKLNEKVKWGMETRVDCVNKALFIKLKKAGCTSIGFGVESGNNKILKIIKKNITVEQASNAVKLAKKVGFMIDTFFILGHPYETRKTILQTIKLAVKLNAQGIAFGIMTPYPESKIYNMALNGKGGYRLISKNWSDYNKNLGNALELVRISRKWLEFYQLLGFFLVYFFNLRIKDLYKIIKENKIHILTLLRKNLSP